MLLHQPFERRPFGVVVVVHVHVGELPATRREMIDERRRRGRFLGLVVRPERGELPLAGGRLLDEAEQEEQLGVGMPERMTLEVEEDVAVVGRRQRGEPDRVGRIEVVDQRGMVGVGRCGEQLERRLVVGCVAGLHLESGLTHERLATGGVDAGHLTIEFGQRGDRRHAILLEREAIGGANSGHVNERVGCAPGGLAHQLELAELAVIARLGTGVGLDALGQELGELAAQATPVRQHIGDADSLGPTRPQLDVHPLGQHAGARRDRLGVEAQLQHVTGLGLPAGELRVDRFPAERPARHRRMRSSTRRRKSAMPRMPSCTNGIWYTTS